MGSKGPQLLAEGPRSFVADSATFRKRRVSA